MAVKTILDREVWLGGWDLTGQTRSNQEAMETAFLDATVYGGDTEIGEPGRKGYGFSGEGFWAGGDDAIDDVLFDQQRTRNMVVSFALDDGSVGSVARTVKAMIAEYQFGASHGDLVPVTYGFAAMDRPLRGFILHNAAASGDVTGTAVQLGAVGAAQFVYGALHVFSGSGNFTAKIQSASDQAFTSPNDRITFTQVGTGTARSYEWGTPAAGAITDTWWRVVATNPATRDFAVVAAIR